MKRAQDNIKSLNQLPWPQYFGHLEKVTYPFSNYVSFHVKQM